MPLDAASLSARMEEIIRPQVFMGAVLVASNNNIILNRGYGSADLEWKNPELTNYEVSYWIHHQAIHGRQHSSVRRAWAPEIERSGFEIHTRCPGELARYNNLSPAHAYFRHCEYYDISAR